MFLRRKDLGINTSCLARFARSPRRQIWPRSLHSPQDLPKHRFDRRSRTYPAQAQLSLPSTRQHCPCLALFGSAPIGSALAVGQLQRQCTAVARDCLRPSPPATTFMTLSALGIGTATSQQEPGPPLPQSRQSSTPDDASRGAVPPLVAPAPPWTVGSLPLLRPVAAKSPRQ